MRKGIFEKPPGSGVWWINYFVNGKRHREKVGRKSDAQKLYQVRKADALAGRKLPKLGPATPVTLSKLIDVALEFTAHHKDKRNYEGKARIVREALGTSAAEELTPQEIERWLRSHCRTAATGNRYRAFLSLCYREGIRNGLVKTNPARLVRQRPEGPGRLRYFTRDEYDRICRVIRKRFPQHLAEIVVSVHTGMRPSELYTVQWSQVDWNRRAIELTVTKNGYARSVRLNADALEAMRSMQHPGQRPSDRVFPRATEKHFQNKSWFTPVLDEAKITGATFYTSRHTFCSWLAMAGASIKDIQEAAGHKTITMSARYSHLSGAHAVGCGQDRYCGNEQPPKQPPEPRDRKTAEVKIHKSNYLTRLTNCICYGARRGT